MASMDRSEVTHWIKVDLPAPRKPVSRVSGTFEPTRTLSCSRAQEISRARMIEKLAGHTAELRLGRHRCLESGSSWMEIDERERALSKSRESCCLTVTRSRPFVN